MIKRMRDPKVLNRRQNKSWPSVNNHGGRNISVRTRPLDRPAPRTVRSVSTSPQFRDNATETDYFSDVTHSHSLTELHARLPARGESHSSASLRGLETYVEDDANLSGSPGSYAHTQADRIRSFYTQSSAPASPRPPCPGCSGTGACPYCQEPPTPGSDLSRAASHQLMSQGVNFCPACRHPAARCACVPFPHAVPPLFPDYGAARCFEKGHGCQHCEHCRFSHGGRRKADLMAPNSRACLTCQPYSCDGCGLPNPERDGSKLKLGSSTTRMKTWPFHIYPSLSRDPFNPLNTNYQPTTCVRCKPL